MAVAIACGLLTASGAWSTVPVSCACLPANVSCTSTFARAEMVQSTPLAKNLSDFLSPCFQARACSSRSFSTTFARANDAVGGFYREVLLLLSKHGSRAH